MQVLSSAAENKLVVLGLGITTTWAVLSLMRHLLVIYRDSVEVQKPRPKTQYITQGTEDSLKITTLEKLVDSHNYGIQETASRIVCDRALHDGTTLDILLWEITSPDHDKREQAIRAMYMLIDHSGMVELNKPKVFNAIVTCLEFCVNDVPHGPYDKKIDNFDFRDPVERFCLLVLFRLTMEFGSLELIRVGIVHRWLAKEPWGTTEKDILDNFRNCYSNMRLSELILRIAHHERGVEELLKAKLIDASRPISSRTNTDDGDEGPMVMVEGGPRLQEQSAEERHLRRRHREAMVLNDGVQPIGVSDIIEREYESPVEERRQ